MTSKPFAAREPPPQDAEEPVASFVYEGATAFRGQTEFVKIYIGKDEKNGQNLPIMHRQPDGGLRHVSPFHPVSPVGGNIATVAGAQANQRRFVFKPQFSCALQQQHPFVRVLIVPKPWRRNVAKGDNALDPDNVA